MRQPVILDLAEVTSTNDIAKTLLRQGGYDIPDIVIARHQTNGRGQRNNIWISSAGKNLTATVILGAHDLEGKSAWEISMSVTLALRDLISRETKQDCFVKWPNDIIIEDKKIAGILIENIWSGDAMKHSIIGIGINLHQRDFGNIKSAVSVCNYTLHIKNAEHYSIDIFNQILYFAKTFGLKELTELYNQHLYRKNERWSIEYGGVPVSDAMIGVDQDGFLITQDDEDKYLLHNHPETRVILRT